MTNEGEFESADPVAASPRKPARSTLVVALLLVLVGAIAAFVVAHLGPPDPDPGADGPAAPDPDAAGLRAHGAPPRPVPPGTVDVTVVEQAGGAPVAGVEVAARRTLTDDASLASTATTDDTGRARLRGEWPAFVELRSDVWTAVPLRAAVDERTRLRIEVVRQAPFDVRLVDERSGLPVAGWTVGSVDGEGASLGVARADAGGAAALAPSRRPPAIVAATDGGSHLRAFFLTAIPRRTGARLEVSPDVRTTIVRCLDEAGGPVGGALLSVASGNSGISVVADERGEAVVESASRTGLTLVASAPGRSPRTLHVDAASPRTVVLLPTLSRRFRVRTADGTRVPEGASLRGFTRGPLAYGIDGAGTEFRGRTEGETCVVPDLPAGPFEGLVLVEGDGISTLARVLAGDDASQPIELVVGPPRTFTLVGIVSSDPTRTATAVVRVDGVRTCSGDGFDAARDLREAFEGGLPIDPLGQCFVVRGPDARLTAAALDGAPPGRDPDRRRRLRVFRRGARRRRRTKGSRVPRHRRALRARRARGAHRVERGRRRRDDRPRGPGGRRRAPSRRARRPTRRARRCSGSRRGATWSGRRSRTAGDARERGPSSCRAGRRWSSDCA